MKKKGRQVISLACSNCKERNYSTMKNKKTQTEKLELKKYCRICRVHTLHKETK
ncbi:MAG: 50S ribosomal protein L33 [bacterium]